MFTNQVFYVHLRNTLPNGMYAPRGGATIAWRVFAGNIHIGMPARCKSGKNGDMFNKRIGRIQALSNLMNENLAFVVGQDVLTHIARSQMYVSLTSNGVLQSVAKSIVNRVGIVEETMSLRWFEEIVRLHFSLDLDGALYIATNTISMDSWARPPHWSV